MWRSSGIRPPCLTAWFGWASPGPICWRFKRIPLPRKQAERVYRLRRGPSPADDQIDQRLALLDLDRVERALQRTGQLLRPVDALAIAAIDRHQMLVMRVGAQLRHRHAVGARRMPVGKDAQRRAFDLFPHAVVEDDEQHRQIERAQHVMPRGRIAEHVGAVADHRDHRLVGIGELGPDRRADADAEPARARRASMSFKVAVASIALPISGSVAAGVPVTATSQGKLRIGMRWNIGSTPSWMTLQSSGGLPCCVGIQGVSASRQSTASASLRCGAGLKPTSIGCSLETELTLVRNSTIGMAKRSAKSPIAAALGASRAAPCAMMSGRSALARIVAACAICSSVGPGTVPKPRRGGAVKLKPSIFCAITSRGR